MNYERNTQALIHSYEAAVAWGNADHEEALHEAVRVGFPGIGEEGQAELYARIADAWEGYRTALVPRKLWIGQIVVSFMAGRTSSAVSGLKVQTNVKPPFKRCSDCECKSAAACAKERA